MRQRLVQFDVLKGIGILLVLLGHTDVVGIPKTFIYGFHMPLFFFCSGCFYRQKGWGDFLKDNVRSLLIPYLLLERCSFYPFGVYCFYNHVHA